MDILKFDKNSTDF